MLKTFHTALAIFFSYTVLNAQEIITKDSSITPDQDSVEVVITPKKGQDSTIVKVGGMKIIVLNDGKKTNEIIIDEAWNDDSDSTKSDFDDDDDDDNIHHWSGIRMGVNGYLVKNQLAMPSANEFLELDYAKSISWDLNLLEKDFSLLKNNIELVTGLGMHFANYHFKSDYATLSNTDPLSATRDSTRILEKNKLRATYLTAPLLLGLSTNKDQDKAFRIAFGAQLSWRVSSKLKQRYTMQGETYTPKIKSDYDLNPFLFHAIASIGYGPINVYANYGLNTLFSQGKTVNLTPFDVGLQVMF